MTSPKFKVGFIGCGNIAPAYIRGCRDFAILEVVACADSDSHRAATFADTYGLQARSVGALLNDPTIQIVVNLTIPKAHAEISLAAIQAGKHIYSEKPLATHQNDGAKILAAATAKNLRVGCAPDTFLGGGLQTCRKLIDDGLIGEPVAATAFMAIRGHESWHPNPEFYYQPGGGPLFDMGPYYLTALVNCLGAVRRVTAATRRSFAERTVTSQPRFGDRISVEVDTHVSGILDFASGPVATIIMSFDVWQHELPIIEIYGTAGTLSVPDPNEFGGVVRLWQAKDPGWREISLTHRADVRRGIGVADMAYGLLSGRSHRASGELAYHVLEVMQAFGQASTVGRHVMIESHCSRPAPLPIGLKLGELDE
jgi:predicted dehydrogenase